MKKKMINNIIFISNEEFSSNKDFVLIYDYAFHYFLHLTEAPVSPLSGHIHNTSNIVIIISITTDLFFQIILNYKSHPNFATASTPVASSYFLSIIFFFLLNEWNDVSYLRTLYKIYEA